MNSCGFRMLKIVYACFVRDVFFVDDEVLCVPKLYVQVPTYILHVIDNDTGIRVKQVFQKVVPHYYKKNKVI